jgi:hypothetical protein
MCSVAENISPFFSWRSKLETCRVSCSWATQQSQWGTNSMQEQYLTIQWCVLEGLPPILFWCTRANVVPLRIAMTTALSKIVTRISSIGWVNVLVESPGILGLDKGWILRIWGLWGNVNLSYISLQPSVDRGANFLAYDANIRRLACKPVLTLRYAGHTLQPVRFAVSQHRARAARLLARKPSAWSFLENNRENVHGPSSDTSHSFK